MDFITSLTRFIVQKLAPTQTTFENFNSKYLSLWRLLTKYKTKHYWSYAVWHPLCDINKKISVHGIDNNQCDSQSNKESSWTKPLPLPSISYLQYELSIDFPDVPEMSLCMLYLNDVCSGYVVTAAKQRDSWRRWVTAEHRSRWEWPKSWRGCSR
jgi:hypothetical protein